ncbi:MAG: type II toxin-antitoxin system VapC family toxin [Hymenobacter sp.]|nr:MAG: type II toxin-antitoxin system VapC family toxin [Hymenobacter sp.]
MRYLVDTHTLLWYSQNDSQLPTAVAGLLQQPDAICYMSRASLIEIAIKLNIGKLKLLNPFALWLAKTKFSGFRLLEIQNSHLLEFLQLPLHHRDPFDRLLIAQALAEDLTLVSRDGKFKEYAGLKLRWE